MNTSNGFMKKIIILACVILILTNLSILSNMVAADRLYLTTKTSCNEITLSWNSFPYARSYLPYQVLDDGKERPLIDSASNNMTFTHKNLEENKEYCYIVKANDKQGKEIARSVKQCAKTLCNNSVDECVYRMEFIIDSKTLKLQILGANKTDLTKKITSPPVLVKNRVYISAKYVTDNLKEARIEWDAKDRVVIIYAKIFDCCIPARDCCGKKNTPYTTKIMYKIGKGTVNIDGQELPIDKTNPEIAPLIIGGSTMIPFRSLGEGLGALVSYLPSDKKMILDFPCNANKELDDGKISFFCKCLKVIEKRISEPTGVIAQDNSGNKFFVYIDTANPLYNQIVTNTFISVTGLTERQFNGLQSIRGLSMKITQGYDCNYKSTSLVLSVGSQTATLDGNLTKLSMQPILSGSDIMIGMRDFSTITGAPIHWDNATQTVNMTFCDTYKIACKVGSLNAEFTIPLSGNAHTIRFKLSEAPTILKGNVYIPVKSIVLFIGGSFDFDSKVSKNCKIDLTLCPCTTTAKWSDGGVIQSVKQNQSNQLEIKMKDCKTGKVDSYLGDPNIDANNSSSITWTNNFKLGNYGVGNCAKFYYVQNDTTPKTNIITQWIAVPPNDPACCSTISTGAKLFCSCLKVLEKITTNPTGVTAINYIGEKHFIAIDTANPIFNQISTGIFISVVGITDNEYYGLPGVNGLIIQIAQGYDCNYKSLNLKFTEGSQNATLNNKKISLAKLPIKSGSELMVGIRDFTEIMGVSLFWDKQKQTLVFEFCGNYKITCQIDSTNAVMTIPLTGNIYSFQFTLSKAPIIKDGITYISFNSIVEYLGGTCTYESNSNMSCTVKIAFCQCQ